MCANYLTLNNRTGILFTINMLQSLNDLRNTFGQKVFFFMSDNHETFAKLYLVLKTYKRQITEINLNAFIFITAKELESAVGSPVGKSIQIA